MRPETWRRIRIIFERARGLRDPQREHFLARICADDDELRRHVEAMLAGHEQTDGFLDQARVTPVPRHTNGSSPPARRARQRVDGYRIVRPIASGGMGTVYEAEQVSPRRTVALKVMNAGLASEESRRRFEYEAEILARLSHPGIAQIFEAGTHLDEEDSGLATPFFAMEYVEGARHITRYVESRPFDAEEVLSLFLLVCDAVHHGHQRGVIHRDLKPSNILVDTKGMPRVIDYGVARWSASDRTTVLQLTRRGQVIGTISYISPEQVRGDPTIDVRSDVYSLGVILYELLCGTLPHDLEGKSLYEAARIVCDEPPRKPRRPGAAIPRDIEWILLRAMEKDREQRYASVSELATDVRRFLDHQTVLAGPPSALYSARRFVRRHRVGVLFTAVAFALLLGGVSSTALALGRTRRALARAEAAEEEARRAAATTEDVMGFVSSMFAEQWPEHARGEEVTVARVLERSSNLIAHELVHRPHIRARLMEFMGTLYQSLGLYAKAEPLHAEALSFYCEEVGEAHPLARVAMDHLAHVYWRLGHLEKAETLLLRAIALASSSDPEGYRLATLTNLGGVYLAGGRLDEAEAIYREVLESYGNEDEPESLVARSNLATLLERRGRYDEAETYFESALAGQRRVLGDDHRDTLATLGNLAMEGLERGDYARAQELLIEALAGNRRVLGDDHHQTLALCVSLASVYRIEARFGEAEHLLLDTIERYRRAMPGHPDLCAALNNLGNLLVDMDRLPEAEPVLSEALHSSRVSLGHEHVSTLALVSNLARVRRATRRFDDAEALFLEAASGYRHALGPIHPETLATLNNLANLYVEQGRLAEAEVLYEEALAGKRVSLGATHPSTLNSLGNLAGLYADLGRVAEAEELQRQVLEERRRVLAERSPDTLRTLSALSHLLVSEGRLGEAEPLLLEALAGQRAVLGDGHTDTLSTLHRLAFLYHHARRPLEAEPLALELVERTPATDPESASRAALLGLVRRAVAEGQ